MDKNRLVRTEYVRKIKIIQKWRKCKKKKIVMHIRI